MKTAYKLLLFFTICGMKSCVSQDQLSLEKDSHKASPKEGSNNFSLEPAAKERTVAKLHTTESPASGKKSEKGVVKSSKKTLKTVNKIAIIVYVNDGPPLLITQLDLERKSLDGRTRTKEEVLLERLLYHEATVSYRLPIPDDQVDKHLASIKELHGVSEEQIAELFMKEGYTFEEGKEQLRMSHAIQNLTYQFITSRLVVTEKEIQAFHEAHPEKEPASFKVKKGKIAKTEMTENEIDELVQDGLHQERVEWIHPYWIEERELSEAKKFITQMQPGQIKVIPGQDGYEVIMLLKRKKERIKSLDERRRDIADQIRMPKYQKMLEEFHKSVLEKYEIVDLT